MLGSASPWPLGLYTLTRQCGRATGVPAKRTRCLPPVNPPPTLRAKNGLLGWDDYTPVFSVPSERRGREREDNGFLSQLSGCHNISCNLLFKLLEKLFRAYF